METAPSSSFLVRHEFLIRRLHSLSGLIPVGAYMVIHLMTNALVRDPAAYQRSVYQIHSLGALLPVVEWTFIFIPILFHAIIGVVILRGGLPNSGTYAYPKNVRYTLQRATGMIAFVFIAWHVFHMHGWFHFDVWAKSISEPLGGAQFRPYSAASSLGAAMSGVVVQLLYAIGVFASVYHLANGIWTMGITWGVWISPAAQKRADVACTVFGIGLAAVSVFALWGAATVDQQKAAEIERKMREAKIASGEISEEEAHHKTLPDESQANASQIQEQAESH